MHTIEKLAEELNRKEWVVVRKLKAEGYLKKNGEPKSLTVEDGLMNEDGLIKNKGWKEFIDVVGYKEKDEDQYDEDENDEDENGNDEDEDTELVDEEEIKEKFRNELSGDIDDSSVVETIVDDCYKTFMEVYGPNDEDPSSPEVIEMGCNMILDTYIPVSISCLKIGHTLAFVEKLIFGHIVEYSLDHRTSWAYREMSYSEIEEDLRSIFETKGFEETSIEFLMEHLDDFDEFEPELFMVHARRYNDAFIKGMEHYNDEDKAKRFAEICYPRNEIPDFDDRFEDFINSCNSWKCTSNIRLDEDFELENTYDAATIIDWYYENSQYITISYPEEYEISFHYVDLLEGLVDFEADD